VLGHTLIVTHGTLCVTMGVWLAQAPSELRDVSVIMLVRGWPPFQQRVIVCRLFESVTVFDLHTEDSEGLRSLRGRSYSLCFASSGRSIPMVDDVYIASYMICAHTYKHKLRMLGIGGNNRYISYRYIYIYM
jgi:hypothetical protein